MERENLSLHGNPALHPLAPVIALGHRNSHSFALETQGSMSQPWFAELDWLILSPKPPSSGMTTDWTALGSCLVVAFDDFDLAPIQMKSSRHFNSATVGNAFNLYSHGCVRLFLLIRGTGRQYLQPPPTPPRRQTA
jgi:organic radical activating enzyme